MSELADELRAILEGVTPAPWRECGHDRGGCDCAAVWSQATDVLVTPEWPDTPRPPLEERKANAKAIRWLRNNAERLAKALEDKDEEITALRRIL